MRIFRRQRRQGNVQEDSRLSEARRARIAAEHRLAEARRDVIVPLRDMHKENHIQPLINALIQRRVRREAQ